MAGPQRATANAEQVFPNFPYDRKFTRAEIDGILAKAKRLGDAMRDGLAPSGHALFIPGDIFELWMIHGALAGCDVDEDEAFIRAKRLPDANGRFVDAQTWVLKKEDTAEKRAEDAEREADAYVRAMDENLRPEVRDAVRRKMRAAAAANAEYLADDPQADAKRDTPKDFGAPRLLQFGPDEQEQQ